MKQIFATDARLFGLLIWPKRLTDAQYIERVRKNLRMQRWLRIMYGAIGVAIVLLAVFMIEQMFGVLWQLGGQQWAPLAVFLVALIAGFNVGWIFVGFMHGAMTMIIESRRDRLLVESWDLLQQLIAERETTATAGL